MIPLEDRVMHDLVQEDREIEDGESLHDREGDPDERVLEMDESPGRQPENRELAERDQQMPCAGLSMKDAHLVARDRAPELRPQARGVLRVVV